MKRLHWSLDYSHQSTEQDFVGEFSQILSAALSASPIEPECERKRHRYALLPGWWSFFRENPYSDSGIQIGHGIIDRRIDGRGTWWYHIEHVNSASGEELTLEFSGADAPERPLRDTWSIRRAEQRRWSVFVDLLEGDL